MRAHRCLRPAVICLLGGGARFAALMEAWSQSQMEERMLAVTLV
jgi:hypothetical protein